MEASKIYVPPAGSTEAEIILIGEAPASEEIAHKPPTPFVGSAGQYLDMILKMVSMYRGNLYITNLRKYPAPRFKMANVTYSEILEHQKELIEEINSLENPRILVPLGKYALEAVTNKSGITNFRGSVLKPKPEIKHDCLVVPTFHPSIMHYTYTSWPYIVADLTKVRKLKKMNYKFEFPEYELIFQPSFEQVMNVLSDLEAHPKRLTVLDVENPHSLLSCIGLAWSRKHAISIPFYWGSGRDYWSFDEELAIWKRLGQVLPKMENLAAQNVMYDWEVMRDHGIILKPAFWDSMLMHACLYSEMAHKLDAITSVFTDVEFYKRSSDDDEKRSAIKAGKERDHWEYNMMDCISCLWAIEELTEELEEEGMMSVYKTFFGEMIDPLYQMNMRGVPVDVKKLPKVREDLGATIEEKNKEIASAVGYEINSNSYPQVRKALEDLKMVLPRNKEGNISTDKKALEKLAYKYHSNIPTLILEVREDRSFLSSFDDKNITDGRFHTHYTLSVTKTGRLAARKPVSKKGRNLQNVKKGPARSFFIAEPGGILLGGDQMQAEARIVAYYSKDENYIKAAESGRIHFNVMDKVFGKGHTKEDKEYDITKRLVHGSDYGLGPWGFAYQANIPFTEAKQKQQEFFDAYPGIVSVYYAYIEECIRKTRTLHNVFGRRQIFLDRLNDSTFRKGYAFIPQSTSGDITKQALKTLNKYYQMLLDLHDGLMMSVPRKEVKYAIEAMHEAFDIPFKIWGIERRIPIEVTVGENWNEMRKI